MRREDHPRPRHRDPGPDGIVATTVLDEDDHVSNLHPATWPDGNDVEVLSLPALGAAALEAERNFERKYTTPFLQERPERFRIGNVERADGRDLSMTHCFVLDFHEDYAFCSRVYDELHDERPRFSGEDVLVCKPQIARLDEKWAG